MKDGGLLCGKNKNRCEGREGGGGNFYDDDDDDDDD